MLHAVSGWRASLTRRLSPPGGQCGNLTGTYCESLRTHTQTHKTTCLLVKEYVSMQLHDIAHAPSLQPHRPTLLPVCIPPLVWRSAPTPQTRSGAPNEQHSSKSRPFDRCKSTVPLPRSPSATLWPQRLPRRAVELHVPTKPGRLA